MKKENLKKDIDNIEISEMQKLKIYNSIMNNRKKKKNWIPLVSFGVLAAASLTIFFVTNNVNPPVGAIPNEPSNGNVNETINKPSNGTMALEQEFTKEVIVNVKGYLNSKDIDLNSLKDGEEKVIDSKEIISDDKYEACEGSVIIKRYSDDFSYSTSITCGDYDRNGASVFKIYDGNLRDVFEIENDVAVVSQVNYDLNNIYHYSCDANVTLFDEKGELVWNHLIKRLEGTEGHSIISVIGINKIGNNYYILYEDEYMTYYEGGNGAGYGELYYNVLILNEKGEVVNIIGLPDMSVNQFIGSVNNVAYYTASFDRQYFILKVNKNGFETIEYEVYGEDEETQKYTNNKVELYEDGYFYGAIITKSYIEDYYSRKTVFKMNEKGEFILKKDVDVSILGSKDYDVVSMYVNDNYIYLVTDEQKILVYDLDFNYIKQIKVSSLDNENCFLSKIRFDDNKIIFELQEYKNSTTNYKLVITDKDFNKLNVVDIRKENVDENFEWSELTYKKLVNNKVNTIYAVKNGLDSYRSILLMFYE